MKVNLNYITIIQLCSIAAIARCERRFEMNSATFKRDIQHKHLQ